MARSFAILLMIGCCSITLVDSQEACAQERPKQNYLVGDRALGLAGAFVGLADDASAIYHNPAGIAFLPGGTLNTSLWAAAYLHQDVGDGFVTETDSSVLDFTTVRTLPFFLAGSARFGNRKAGVQRHVIGFGILSPFTNRYDFSVQQQGDNEETGAPSAARLDVHHDESSQWFGPSYAYLLSSNAAFGFSSFVTNWFLRHEESQVRSEQGPAGDILPGAVQTYDVRLHRRLVHLTFRLGGLYRPGGGWQLGAMLQPPGIPLYGEVRANAMRSDVSEGDSDFESFDTPRFRVSPHSAWEVRLGASQGDEDSGTVSLDASVLGPDVRTDVPEELAEWTEVDAFPQGTNLRPTLRGAVGYSFLLSRRYPIRGGVLGEYTVRADSDDPLRQAAAADTIGAAFSAGHRFEDFDLSVGVTITRTTARLLVPAYSNAESFAPFLPTDIARTTVFLYLSGGSQAAKLLKDAVRDALITSEDE